MTTKRGLLLLLIVLVMGGIAFAVLSKSGHDFTDQQCQDCHAMTPVKGKRETLRMKAPIRTLCKRCHDAYIENSLTHPVEMKPVSSLPPADLPLSWDGKMTCSTCHDIHAVSQASALLGSRSLRRNVSGAELCSACHATSNNFASTGKGGNHGPGMTFAHMKYVPDADSRGDRIDRLSRMCLSCHDGSLGTNADAQISVGSWRHGASFSGYDPQGSHPIGVKYRAAMRRGGLRPISSLNSAIKLIDGKVGCPSCHDPFSKEPLYLVVSNTRLCTECHDK